jgi:hypothetical protein
MYNPTFRISMHLHKSASSITVGIRPYHQLSQPEILSGYGDLSIPIMFGFRVRRQLPSRSCNDFASKSSLLSMNHSPVSFNVLLRMPRVLGIPSLRRCLWSRLKNFGIIRLILNRAPWHVSEFRWCGMRLVARLPELQSMSATHWTPTAMTRRI